MSTMIIQMLNGSQTPPQSTPVVALRDHKCANNSPSNGERESLEMKRICLHPWFSASLRQGEGEGTRILKRRHCAPSALCSSCMRIPLLGDLPVSCNQQQVMHYIFTWSWRIQIQNVVANTSTNTCQFHATGDALHIHLPGAGEARQIQKAKLDKYKM